MPNSLQSSLNLFNSSNVFETASDNLFIERVIVTNTGSGYIGSPTILFSMITGSVVVSASAFTIVENNKLLTVRLTSSGLFSLNAKISGSVVVTNGGTGAAVYVSLNRSKKINAFLTKPPIIDGFEFLKEKVKLVLLTRKGEVPLNDGLGTRIYSKLLNFDQIQSVTEYIDEIRITLGEDIESQIPEAEVVDIRVNETDTNIDKNIIAILITIRHRINHKTNTLGFSINNGNIGIIRDYFKNEDNEEKLIRYL